MLLLEAVSLQLVYWLTIVLLSAIVILTLMSQFGRFLYLELTTHFRLQYLLASAVCSGAFIVFQSWKFAAIALICALFNAIYIWPYYRTNPKGRTDSSRRLRLLHTNVLKNNRNHQAVLDLVANSEPDLVVLQEVDESWGLQLQSLEKTHGFFKIVARPDGAGMAIFSRVPFADLQLLSLDASAHLAILARLNVNGELLTILGLHPPTPITPGKFKNRNRQFREATAVLNKLGGPKILIGDLNTTMWSQYFTRLAQDSKLRDTRLGLGLKTSWPMPLPSFLRLPIDHCLVSQELVVERLEIGAPIGSDHLPLVIDVGFASKS